MVRLDPCQPGADWLPGVHVHQSRRFLRGGGWRDNTPGLLAADRELIVTPKVATEDYGFRCILILKHPAKPH